jgi:GNAT superfamily N-acetyltransferase
MRIAFRPAVAEDFDYCRRVYFAELGWIIEALHLESSLHAASFVRDWVAAEVRIITLDGSDIGWLQSAIEDDALFIAQLIVERPFQRGGIGTAAIHRLIAEAAEAGRPVRLSVVKINPAMRLYERLGFRICHEDDCKFYMKRDAEMGWPPTAPAAIPAAD